MAQRGRRLNEKKRKLIRADYLLHRNYSEVARIHDVSQQCVRNIVEEDPEYCKVLEQNDIEVDEDILTYFKGMRGKMREVMALTLQAMADKAAKPDMFTNIRDLATAFGVVADKQFKIHELEHERDQGPPKLEIILRRDGDSEDEDSYEEPDNY